MRLGHSEVLASWVRLYGPHGLGNGPQGLGNGPHGLGNGPLGLGNGSFFWCWVTFCWVTFCSG